jgi:oxygen-independent coproporphyrinogen-3 oxidase
LAGIYIHIPFCKQACTYCNFHFSTSIQLKKELVNAICTEIDLRHHYLKDEQIRTIYFGGGTPSLLHIEDVKKIIAKIAQYFDLNHVEEITLEANPDDLHSEKLKELRDSPVNRLSIGIQSFDDADLAFMNRSHNAKESLECIDLARKFDFELLTIDLIYGLPSLINKDTWTENLNMCARLELPHFSAYALTVEPKTLLDHKIKKGKLAPLDEEKAIREFQQLLFFADNFGYEHYEISNFAKPGMYSKHNTAYWQGNNYLGLGPSAHSFNGISRSWNIANNGSYIRKINNNEPFFEEEQLSLSDQFNEWVLTRIRTKDGISKLDLIHWPENLNKAFLKDVEKYLANEMMVLDNEHFRLTRQGMLFADAISADLFAE